VFSLDHPYHRIEILGGMWGLKVAKNKELSNKIFKKIIDSKIYSSIKEISKRNNDQLFLRDKIYHLLRNVSIIHDSYHCKLYKDSEPFPTKRDGFSFVGFTDVYRTVNEYCPIECRPINHSDWMYC
jgi:hypothetical protein